MLFDIYYCKTLLFQGLLVSSIQCGQVDVAHFKEQEAFRNIEGEIVLITT